MKNKEYPSQVCRECGLYAHIRTYGDDFGDRRQFQLSTWHLGVCDVCEVEKNVTEPRDFFHPNFKGFSRLGSSHNKKIGRKFKPGTAKMQCLVDGCENQSRSSGLCKTHYNKQNFKRWRDRSEENRAKHNAMNRENYRKKKGIEKEGVIVPVTVMKEDWELFKNGTKPSNFYANTKKNQKRNPLKNIFNMIRRMSAWETINIEKKGVYSVITQRNYLTGDIRKHSEYNGNIGA